MNEWEKLAKKIVRLAEDARTLREDVAQLYNDGARREEANLPLSLMLLEIQSTLATAAAYLPSMSTADLLEQNKRYIDTMARMQL